MSSRSLKIDQNVFRSISYKTSAILMTFIHYFMNEFAVILCKCFPLHLNNVSTLPRKMLIGHVLPLSCYGKETPEFIPLQLWPPFSPDLNPVDNSMSEILHGTVHKTRITDLEHQRGHGQIRT